MNNLEPIRTELNSLTKAIVDKLSVEQIYLFGSHVYGTPNEDSDLDLYVVLPDNSPLKEIDALTMMRLAMYKVQDKPIDLFAMKKARFLYKKDGQTLENIVYNKGVKLYG